VSASGSIPPKLAAVVSPVIAIGLVAVGVATWSLTQTAYTATDAISIVALLVAFTFAERFPVPVQGAEANGVSLGFVFALAAILLFGWDVGVVVAAAAPMLMQLLEHRPPLRIAYNGGTYAVAAAVAGLSIAPIHGDSVGTLLIRATLCGVIFHVVDTALITAVVSVSSGDRFPPLLRSNIRWTAGPFGLMASAALMLVVLWERSPALSTALVGPLIAIALYQRSTFRELRAMRLALTDPLTGLGNHRHFHERLQRELVAAEDEHSPLTLCLVDIDDFKRINDRFGHPTGDRVLSRVAGRLRQGGEAFRLGGDEFALLLPASTSTLR